MSDEWLLHNASEYTVNGKTYRNLEAEVKYQHDLTEQNAQDIILVKEKNAEQDSRLTDAEDSIESIETALSQLGATVKIATISSTTYAQVLEWVNNGYIVLATNGTILCYMVWKGATFYFYCIQSSTYRQYTLSSEDFWVSEQRTLASNTDVENLVDQKVFHVTYNSTPFADIYNAWQISSVAFIDYNGLKYFLTACSPQTAIFTHVRLTTTPSIIARTITVSSDNVWTIGNQIITETTLSPSLDTRIPTSKAVADYVSQHSGSSVAEVHVRYDSTTQEYIADMTYDEILDVIDADEDIFLTYNYKYFRFNRYFSSASDAPLIFTSADGFPYTGKLETFYVDNTDEWHYHTLSVDPIPVSTTIQNNDRLMVGRSIDSENTVSTGTIAFDTSVTDKFLCQDGTWKRVEGPIPIRQLAANVPSPSPAPITATLTYEVTRA